MTKTLSLHFWGAQVWPLVRGTKIPHAMRHNKKKEKKRERKEEVRHWCLQTDQPLQD